MPSQLTDLLCHLPSEYTRMFSTLFIRFPKELSSKFSHRLASLLNPVRTALPSMLTSLSPSPDNPALSPENTSPSPENPALSPENPALSPDNPALSPDNPALSPENTSLSPENPAPSPDNPALSPENTSLSPENPAPSPDNPALSPENTSLSPENPDPSPENPALSPENTSPSPDNPALSPDNPALSPENPALSPNVHILFTQFINTLTITLGTLLTTVTLISPCRWLGKLCSDVLTILYAVVFVNAPSDLSDMLDLLYYFLDDPPAAQPYSALTSLPSELFALLTNTLPSDLHTSAVQLNELLGELMFQMFWDLKTALEELNEELRNDLNDSLPASPDYPLEGLTVQYVYQAREDTDTDVDKCSVCLEEMKDGDNARRLRCLHDFHKDCIDHWLDTDKTCPLCRTHISATH